jgi:hypothetical protein
MASVSKITSFIAHEIEEGAADPIGGDGAPPQRVAPTSPHRAPHDLADEAVYAAAESSFYDVLHEEGLMADRGDARPRWAIASRTRCLVPPRGAVSERTGKRAP